MKNRECLVHAGKNAVRNGPTMCGKKAKIPSHKVPKWSSEITCEECLTLIWGKKKPR